MGIPLPSYSEIIKLIKTGATIEAQEKIMALREAAMKLQEENLVLKQENIKLKEKISSKNRLCWDGAIYWLGKYKKDGPYCPNCYDTKGHLVHLQDYSINKTHTWFCVSCKTQFAKKPETYDEPLGQDKPRKESLRDQLKKYY